MNAFIFKCKTTGCDAFLEMPEDMPRDGSIRSIPCPVCGKKHDYKFSEATISHVLPCKRDGCGHPVSVHNAKRADKKQPLMGAGQYNPHSDKTDGDACSVPGCDCFAYLSHS